MSYEASLYIATAETELQSLQTVHKIEVI